MNLRESAGFAVRGVLANKLRSLLTTLGILIGVAAVIILVAVGTGSGKAVQDSISRLGSNTLTVTSSQGGTGGRAGRFMGGPPGMGGPGGSGSSGSSGSSGGSGVDTGTRTRLAQLTVDDAAALLDDELAPHVHAVAPVVRAQSVTATYAGATHSVSTFTGTTPSYLGNDNSRVQAGSAFSASDYTGRRRVALLGVSVAEDLVGGNGLSVVGKTVQFNGVDFTVLGVLAEKGSTGPDDADDRVIAR